jgi:hypothetical protein
VYGAFSKIRGRRFDLRDDPKAATTTLPGPKFEELVLRRSRSSAWMAHLALPRLSTDEVTNGDHNRSQRMPQVAQGNVRSVVLVMDCRSPGNQVVRRRAARTPAGIESWRHGRARA